MPVTRHSAATSPPKRATRNSSGSGSGTAGSGKGTTGSGRGGSIANSGHNKSSRSKKASKSKLNFSKTKIYGFGDWENRTNWPITDLKVEMEYFSTLVITFSCKYDLALNKTWNMILNKTKNRIPLIRNNYYTVYQKKCYCKFFIIIQNLVCFTCISLALTNV